MSHETYNQIASLPVGLLREDGITPSIMPEGWKVPRLRVEDKGVERWWNSHAKGVFERLVHEIEADHSLIYEVLQGDEGVRLDDGEIRFEPQNGLLLLTVLDDGQPKRQRSFRLSTDDLDEPSRIVLNGDSVFLNMVSERGRPYVMERRWHYPFAGKNSQAEIELDALFRTDWGGSGYTASLAERDNEESLVYYYSHPTLGASIVRRRLLGGVGDFDECYQENIIFGSHMEQLQMELTANESDGWGQLVRTLVVRSRTPARAFVSDRRVDPVYGLKSRQFMVSDFGHAGAEVMVKKAEAVSEDDWEKRQDSPVYLEFMNELENLRIGVRNGKCTTWYVAQRFNYLTVDNALYNAPYILGVKITSNQKLIACFLDHNATLFDVKYFSL